MAQIYLPERNETAVRPPRRSDPFRTRRCRRPQGRGSQSQRVAWALRMRSSSGAHWRRRADHRRRRSLDRETDPTCLHQPETWCFRSMPDFRCCA